MKRKLKKFFFGAPKTKTLLIQLIVEEAIIVVGSLYVYWYVLDEIPKHVQIIYFTLTLIAANVLGNIGLLRRRYIESQEKIASRKRDAANSCYNLYMKDSVIAELKSILDGGEFLRNEPLDRHISFRVGGAAAFYLIPKDEEQLVSVIRCLRNAGEGYFILGNGTNVIAEDEGYGGVIVATTGDELAQIKIEGNVIEADAGATLALMAKKAAEAGLSGAEQLAGIPGSIGGALRMNAGAYGREIKDVVTSARVYDVVNDKIITVNKDEMELSYRSSVFAHKDYVILSATFSLTEDTAKNIHELMHECAAKRTASQPLDLPSAGSFFKRPPKEGVYAAALIEAVRMKGERVGGAAVSDKHAGFIVNLGGATSEDIFELAKIVSDAVYIGSGYKLEMEPVLIK